MRTATRTNRRPPARPVRAAVSLVLVVAQAVASFGYPMVRGPAGAGPCGGGSCRCKAAPGSAGCCCAAACGARAVAPTPAPKPVPVRACCAPASPCCPPESDAAPPCCAGKPPPAPDPEPAPVVWVAGWKAAQCRGDGPLGLSADVPSAPPVVPAALVAAPRRVGFVAPTDLVCPTRPADPLDPPPRSR